MSSVKRLDSEVLEAFKLFDKDQDGTITRRIQGYIQRHIYLVTENLETMGLFREGTMTGDSIILL